MTDATRHLIELVRHILREAGFSWRGMLVGALVCIAYLTGCFVGRRAQ